MNVVYFARRPNGDIKIGKTSNLSARVAGLSVSGPVEVLAVVADTGETEKQLHQRFADFRMDVTQPIGVLPHLGPPHPHRAALAGEGEDGGMPGVSEVFSAGLREARPEHSEGTQMTAEPLDPVLSGEPADAIALMAREAAAFRWLADREGMKMGRSGDRWYVCPDWWNSLGGNRGPLFSTALEAVEAAAASEKGTTR